MYGKLTCMESNTNNISSAGLHCLDKRQRHSETYAEVDACRVAEHARQFVASTGFTPRQNCAECDCASWLL